MKKIAKTLTLALLVAVVVGCYSKEYNERLTKLIMADEERSKNPILSVHLRCFKCMNNRWPNTVSELKLFSPSTQSCQKAFKYSNLSEADHIPNASISFKEVGGKVSVLIADPSVNFENLSYDANFITKSFTKSALSCNA